MDCVVYDTYFGGKQIVQTADHQSRFAKRLSEQRKQESDEESFWEIRMKRQEKLQEHLEELQNERARLKTWARRNGMGELEIPVASHKLAEFLLDTLQAGNS